MLPTSQVTNIFTDQQFTNPFLICRSYRETEETPRKELRGQEPLRQNLQIPNTIKSLSIREFVQVVA